MCVTDVMLIYTARDGNKWYCSIEFNETKYYQVLNVIKHELLFEMVFFNFLHIYVTDLEVIMCDPA